MLSQEQIDALSQELILAVEGAMEKGYTIAPRVTLSKENLLCCPLGALILHRGLAAKYLNPNNGTFIADLLNLPKFYCFIWGFDNYESTAKEHPLTTLGRFFRHKYVPASKDKA